MQSGTRTYDDVRALVRTQRRMRGVAVQYGAVCAGAIALGAPLALALGATLWVPLGLCALLSVLAVRSVRQLGRLQRRLWRVGLSARHLTLLHVSRRQRTVGWRAVRRVEVTADGLVVVAEREHGQIVRFEIAASFDAYTDLAHDVVALAERWRRPIWIDGQPLARLDVRPLLPSPRSDLSAG